MPPPTDEAQWVTVKLPGETFRLQTRDGLIVDAEPGAQWAIGKPAITVLDYFHRMGARITP
jgi:hypothetical protein